MTEQIKHLRRQDETRLKDLLKTRTHLANLTASQIKLSDKAEGY